VTGAAATAFAKEVMLAQRRSEAMRKRLESLKAAQVTYGRLRAAGAGQEVACRACA
jgi:hypothetical protein